MTTVSLEADSETKRILKEFGHLLTEGEIKFAAAEGAEVLAEEARKVVQKKTGKLFRSIIVRTGRKGGRVAAMVGVDYKGFTKVERPYPFVLEYGNARNSPFPYMRKAKKNKGKEASKVAAESLMKQINKRLK